MLSSYILQDDQNWVYSYLVLIKICKLQNFPDSSNDSYFYSSDAWDSWFNLNMDPFYEDLKQLVTILVSFIKFNNFIMSAASIGQVL